MNGGGLRFEIIQDVSNTPTPINDDVKQLISTEFGKLQIRLESLKEKRKKSTTSWRTKALETMIKNTEKLFNGKDFVRDMNGGLDQLIQLEINPILTKKALKYSDRLRQRGKKMALDRPSILQKRVPVLFKKIVRCFYATEDCSPWLDLEQQWILATWLYYGKVAKRCKDFAIQDSV